MIICPNCQKELEDNVTFCIQCGHMLDSSASPEQESIEVTPVTTPENPPVHPKKGFGVASLVLGILSLIPCLWLFAIPMSIIGLVLSVKCLKAGPLGIARAGQVLSIIGLVLSLLYLVYLIFNGFAFFATLATLFFI